MKNKKNDKPSQFVLAFFRWFCDPELKEEIEGDLLERYHKYSECHGEKKAKIFLIKEVLLLFRPGIIKNMRLFNFKSFHTMKKLQWLSLIGVNLLVVICLLLPYFPGRYDSVSQVLSAMVQITGFFGLLVVPVAIVWLVQEIKKTGNDSTTIIASRISYYCALIATCLCSILFLFFVLTFFVAAGVLAGITSFAVLVFLWYKLIPSLKKLKDKPNKKFNATPAYLLSVPLLAVAGCMFFLKPASEFSRNLAIREAETLINSIENYYNEKGSYPESIDDLPSVPKPSVIGIDNFQYEKNGDGYNLSFEQRQHAYATKEVVMYNKNDQHTVKGHFASYNAGRPHWKYYWLD